MAKKFLTLNIGAATVELAEYEAGSDGALTLVNYGTASLGAALDAENAGTVLSPALLEIVREKGIRPGKVAIAIPGQMAFQRFAAIPMTEGSDKFEQMVRYEVEQNVPFPIDEMVCDRQALGDTENGDKNVLIVAAKLEQVEAITTAVASAGFRPEIVDVAPLALTNALRLNRPEETEACTVILDIGAKTTSLVIAEGEKIYNRSVPVAGNAITKEIAGALGCTTEEAEQAKLEVGYVSMGGVTEDADEVADRVSKACRAVLTRLNAEISRSINFYRSQQQGGVPTKLYLTGGTALLPQIDQFFAESLGVEVEFFNPFEVVAVGPKVEAEALESDGALVASTVGLAAHFADMASFAVNLLPPALVQARAEMARVPFVAVSGVLAAAACLILAVMFSAQSDEILDNREEIEEHAAALKACYADVQAAEADCRAEVARADSLRKLVARRTASIRRLEAVTKAVESHVGMWVDKWEPEGVTVRYWTDRVRSDSKDGKTAAEAISGAIAGNDTDVIDRASVKITSMSEVGRLSQVKQFTVGFKGK